ncbi:MULTISPECIES: Hsp70 family protein [Providencia]|mgnify:FL=1|uniref:Molecular chaperone HscC n=1 Tax=Providencia rettgeri TaxID=587 RepID=A0AB35LFG4_PRORE|nr:MULTISPECIES: molecular chaperone HscC [Providencia]MCG5370979.1 molecular chaperone HscC [Providencia rettgeri]MCL0008833.1 molecular chaperone HscC [Providencia rettgeri]MDH2307095.1 molecular chaperone HscC [Providencia rettgeri]MDH2396373.1 molecular chaperone HscC [Providencia rettgeri]MDT5429036.1 molecular chaperone HscC [Providencia rettgeri]
MDRLATHLVMGIDLGTSNSAVSLWLDGKSVLIPNLQGNVLTPSVVGLDDAGQIIVGQAAHERLQSHPNITKASFKRYMGTDATITLGKLVFRAEEVSALLLRQLKDDVEAWLGYVVKDAVITVPAYFNDVQRRAVKTAGQLAGLNVVRLLNEPTAASLAFGLLENKEHKYLTFDLGGGTFDVSIIDMFEGVIEVCASSGDVRLGGDDFREVIYQWMLKKYPKLHKDQFLIRPELLKLAEHLKLALSQAPECHVSMHWNESDFEWKMTEQELATCCQPLLARLQQPILQALHDSRFSLNDLDDILLVGGATRMPLVRQTVARLFGRFPRHDLNPDEAVALGAGVQAGMVMADCALDDIVLTDVMPFSLGVDITKQHGERFEFGYYLPIIERNNFLPISKMQELSTIVDNQEHILLKVYQGEARLVKDNVFLGELKIDIPPRPAGEVTIEVRFTYTVDGLLEVECHYKGSPKVYRLLIEKVPGQMSEDQISASLAKIAGLKQHPRDMPENRELLARCSQLYEFLLGDDRLWVDKITTEFEAALNSQDLRLIATFRQQVVQFLKRYERDLH